MEEEEIRRLMGLALRDGNLKMYRQLYRSLKIHRGYFKSYKVDVSKCTRDFKSGKRFPLGIKNVWPNDYSARLAIREMAKKTIEYNLKIVPKFKGMTEAGEPLVVDTLGKWAFGVPGFQAMCLITIEDGEVVVYLPKNYPVELERMFEDVKRMYGEDGDDSGEER